VGVWYLDTSAAAKLVVTEDRSEPMREWARAHALELVTSDLVQTELVRAARRADPALVVRARSVLEAVDLVRLDRRAYLTAGMLDPPGLRSLDAAARRMRSCPG
jgi:uncharacterized protein